jgi:UTP--glucose-1-phosphate uridylyltransferase
MPAAFAFRIAPAVTDHHAVRRAVIPAAGRGTRMHPFSLSVPKELAPLGSTPAIHFVLDETERAGIDEVIIVTAPGKELLRRHLELAQAKGSWPGLRLRFAVQDEPTGLADAIALTAPLLGSEPFAVLLPDNVSLAPNHRLDPLLDLWRPGQAVVGVLELDASASGLFGNSGRIDARPLAGGALAIDRLHDKRPGRFEIAHDEPAPVLRACGRYVFGGDVFDLLAASRTETIGELDEVPAVQRLARDGKLFGAMLPMPLFDVGHPSGILAASVHLARARVISQYD